MLKKLVNLIWRGGVQEFKEPKRQLMSEDEFSKKSLIGEEEEYNDMSNFLKVELWTIVDIHFVAKY